MQNNFDVYDKMAAEIVKRQQQIIGPLAIRQAKSVQGISVEGASVSILGDEMHKKLILEKLVKAYYNVFGTVSIDVCRDALKNLDGVEKKNLPDILVH